MFLSEAISCVSLCNVQLVYVLIFKEMDNFVKNILTEWELEELIEPFKGK